jgi:hypothetical protein
VEKGIFSNQGKPEYGVLFPQFTGSDIALGDGFDLKNPVGEAKATPPHGEAQN